MTRLADASIVELRQVIQEELKPQRLVVRRDHGGAISLRVLSDAFTDVADPLEVLEDALKKHRLRLPERTLPLLKAPEDLEGEDEEELFFSQAWLGTPNWGDALLAEPQQPLPADDREFDAVVVAFWGLKGGVGRSTALAHVAAILGQRQRVLAVDLDLESPALVATLTGDNGHEGGARIEELVRRAASTELSDDDLQRDILQSLRRHSDPQHPLEVLGPRVADSRYVMSLLGPLAPASLYRGGRPALRRLLRQAIRASNAELVLLDARSGYCDESAMAVLDLADKVVLFASPAPSTFPSLAPAIEALERNRRARGRPREVHFVAGMLPAGQEAHERILEELRDTLETAREEVAAALDTPADDLPPEVSVIPVDYLPRIVENEGTLQFDASAGYREIAERISPPPLPASVTAVEPGWVSKVLREAEVPVPQAEDEGDPQRLAELFTRTPDLAKFARQDVCLVLGAKGTGKSFLRRMCVAHQPLLVERSGVKTLAGVTFVDGYSQPRGGQATSPPLTADLLRALDQQAGEQWSDIWSALALGRVIARLGLTATQQALVGHARTQLRQLERLAAAGTSKKILTEVQKLIKDPLGLDDAWLLLESWCEKTGRSFILLFDDLDVALGEKPADLVRRNVMVRELIERANRSWMSRRYLGVKIFLREDIFQSLGAQETAKYASRKLHLSWRPEDIWRLIVRAMGSASVTFKAHVESRGIFVEHLDDAAEEEWREALELIWGERLGESESHTRSTVWAKKRLRDGQDRMFPRAALWLLRFAIEERRRSVTPGIKPPLLDGKALRDAMPSVAQERLAELRAESSQEEKARLRRLHRLISYQNEQDFLQALAQAGESDPQAALATYEKIGVVERGKRRDGTPTVRIVDLYAFAPELVIDRRGRR